MLSDITHIIKKGTVDNTVPGTVTLTLECVEIEEPLTFTLEGDCLRDLAGCRLDFVNPHHTGTLRAKEQTFLEIITQRGEYLHIGDFTASRRLCDLDNKRARRNLLSLEIFDIDGGRILIESSSMELTIGEHRWQMEPTDEYAQIMSNQDMYRSHVQQFIDSYTGILDDENDPLPSIPWDGRLRRAEAAAVIYPSVPAKYRQEADGLVRESYVLNRTDRLAELACDEETGRPTESNFFHNAGVLDFLLPGEVDAVREAMRHPVFESLSNLTQEIQSTLQHLLEDTEHGDREPNPTVSEIMRVHGFIVPHVLATILQSQENIIDPPILTSRIEGLLRRIQKDIRLLHQIPAETSRQIIVLAEDLMRQLTDFGYSFCKKR